MRYATSPRPRNIGFLSALCLLVCLLFGLNGQPVSAQEPESLPGTAPTSQARRQPTTPDLISAAAARGEITEEEAALYLAYALMEPSQLPAEYRSSTPWSGTLPLIKLRQKAKTMPTGFARSAVDELLAGACDTNTDSLPASTNSTRFHIEYAPIGGGLTINNYITSLETTWTTEVTSFGWGAPPIVLASPAPGGRYHVRIEDLGDGLYGFVSPVGVHAGFVGDNPNTPWNDTDAFASCMVLHNDYTAFPGTPQQAMDATVAHEFHHSIQFGYGGLSGVNTPDDIFVEGGASWMEDEVFDTANDNYYYLWPNFEMCMGEYTGSPYDYWITIRGLTERFGASVPGGGEDVMQRFWESVSKNEGMGLQVLNQALLAEGVTLPDAYHAYAIAVKFNKSCGGGHTLPYCFEEGSGYVANAGPTAVQGTIGSVGGSFNGSIPDNYALDWVALPATGGSYRVTLNNTSAGGQLRGSLVCDRGTSLSVTPFTAVVGSGASTTIATYNSAGCSSVVAVLTNQAQTGDNPNSCTGRAYQLSTAPVCANDTDVDNNQRVNVVDVQLVAGDFADVGHTPAHDTNCDGGVDVRDILAVANAWTP